jgi:hypothetical protein
VHYLINGEQGNLRAPFQKWMMESAKSDKPADLSSSLGRSLEDIEAALPAYLEEIR